MKNQFIKLFIVLLILTVSFLSYAAIPDPLTPEYFSADIASYPSHISSELLREYLLFDDISPDVKYINDDALTAKMYEQIKLNRNIEGIEEENRVKFGLTSRSVNMKLFPCGDNLHKGNPLFDSNQYTRVSASVPLAVLHGSVDGKFIFVQTGFMRGWIPADAAIIYSGKEFKKTLSLPYITILKDGTDIAGVIYNLGDRVPVSKVNDSTFAVELPNKKTVKIKKSKDIYYGSLAYSDKAMRFFAERLLDDPYDWGGKNGYRDCSSYIRDLWLLFGYELPRNSSMQAQIGRNVIGMPESKKAFFDALANAEPFKTLIFFKGHAIMYGGREGDDYIIYHAVNRLEDDDGDIINFAKVTRNLIKSEKFEGIWKRVIAVRAID